jgi:hypothetical protein
VVALSLPAEAASQVSLATPFTWSAVGGCVYLLAAPQDGTAATFYVLTNQPTASLPDFSALGLSLPAGSGFTGAVFDFCPFADLDEAAGLFGPVGVELLTTNVNSMENRFGLSEVRHFTTAP